ncbi:MAG: hypothetical protein WC295_00875 [Methanoregula sp.]
MREDPKKHRRSLHPAQEDLAVFTRQPHYFWLGEMGMTAVLAVPTGCYPSSKTGIACAFILAMIVFMHLFVFLPKPIPRGMLADAPAVVEVFG